MCGINGYFGLSSHELIEQMNKSISHRGPDGSGIYLRPSTKLALGHVRLSIIDLSPTSDQPMASTCDRYVIVFNGEIYNYKELRESLVGKGYEFKSNGDCEVLLNLWIEYGERSLAMLDGIFSFAIYDTLKDRLTLVRDHFGVKPLYYSIVGDAVIFSSEIKAILQSEIVSRKIDTTSVSAYLCYLWSPGEHTILSEVKKVKPGHFHVFQSGKLLSEEQYYDLPNYTPELCEASALEQLRKGLKKSVDSQLVSDVPVGSFLSGGLDSSLLCALAKESSDSFKEVFTINLGEAQDGFASDLPYAKKVAKNLNLNLNIVESSVSDVGALPACIYHLDEPQSDPAIINTYKICELAKQKNIKVLFSGAGGDDFFTGYRRHLLAAHQSKIDKVPKLIRRLTAFAFRTVPSSSAFGRRVHKVAGILNKTAEESIGSYFFWLEREKLEALFTKDALENIDLERTEKIIREKVDAQEGNLVEKTLSIDKAFFLVDHNFNYTDKMSMAHGVEVRVPIVNQRLAKIAAKIPTELKQKNNVGKSILKKAAEISLSNDIIYRPKTGFGAPVREWLNGPLKPLINSLLSKENIERRGLFDFEQVQALIEDNEKGKGDFAYTIYALLTLEIWMRQFVDVDKPKHIKMEDLVR